MLYSCTHMTTVGVKGLTCYCVLSLVTAIIRRQQSVNQSKNFNVAYWPN